MNRVSVKVLMILALMASLFVFAQEANDAKTVKILMIGNSFSESVLSYFPEMVKNDGTIKMRLRQAYIGGCTIERHLNEYDRAKANPKHRPYTTNLKLEGAPKTKDGKKWRANLPEMLADGTWDIVTIQQGSRHSWDPNTYKADADRLISIVREYQPKAEIVVHETWAYRCDSPRLVDWKIDQAEMHKRVSAAYKGLAARYGFRLIPVGDAVDIFRKQVAKPFKPLTAEEKAALVYPKLPDESGDVVGKSSWMTKKGTTEHELRTDYIHLNKQGRYLQACVWYMYLFGKSGADIKSFPKDMDAELCRTLIKCAEKAIQDNK